MGLQGRLRESEFGYQGSPDIRHSLVCTVRHISLVDVPSSTYPPSPSVFSFSHSFSSDFVIYRVFKKWGLNFLFAEILVRKWVAGLIKK